MGAGSSFPNNSVFSKKQGGEWEFDANLFAKVSIGAVAPGVVLYVDSGVNSSAACIGVSTTVATSSVILAAQGGGTATQVRGWMVTSMTTTIRKFEMRFGGTAFANGYIGAGAINWNYVGHYVQATNKAVKLYVNGAGTFTATVNYKLVAV